MTGPAPGTSWQPPLCRITGGFVRKLLISVASLSTLSATPAQSPVDATIDKAVAAYGRIKTARGEFQQTITNALTGSTVSSRGEFQQQQPGRYAFVFTQPKGDLIVADGSSLWLYLPSTNPGQAIKSAVGDGGAGNIDLAGQFFTSPRTRFTIADAGTATITGRPTRALTLDPKKPGQAFTHAKVWIDTEDGTLRQFETTEQSGLKRLVTVTKFALNAPVDEKAFRFTPPKGVRIYEQGKQP
jgi:outer membrane lipoprotein carrier protein